MVFHEEIPENRSLLKGLCQRFWKAPFICQDLSHCLIVSKVFYYKSFYGGYRRSFLALFLGSFARGIFFNVDLQCPLIRACYTDRESTMATQQ